MSASQRLGGSITLMLSGVIIWKMCLWTVDMPVEAPDGGASVAIFTLRPLIRLACGEPPSPEGEGFGAVELGGCRGKPTLAAGACPRPTKGTCSFPKLLSCNEPGDTLRWRSTDRVSGSN